MIDIKIIADSNRANGVYLSGVAAEVMIIGWAAWAAFGQFGQLPSK